MGGLLKTQVQQRLRYKRFNSLNLKKKKNTPWCFLKAVNFGPMDQDFSSRLSLWFTISTHDCSDLTVKGHVQLISTQKGSGMQQHSLHLV